MLKHFAGWLYNDRNVSPKAVVSSEIWRTSWHDGGTGEPRCTVYQPKTRMLTRVPDAYTISPYRKLNRDYPTLAAALKDVANHIITYERWHTVVKIYPNLVTKES